MAESRRAKLTGWLLVGLIVVAAAMILQTLREAPSSAPEYEYDARNDRYWDPDHGHWHDGTPPDFEQGQLDQDADTPEPWEYNPETNRHWDPNHGHWHDGFPPTGAAPGLNPTSLTPPEISLELPTPDTPAESEQD